MTAHKSALLFLVVLVGAACSSSTTGTDLGLVEPGCRVPSACFKTGADCSCARADVTEVGGSCRACDPSRQTCICAMTGQSCLEVSAVCVGRGAVCPGTGARCLKTGASCSDTGGDPPQLVATGAGAAVEPRCTFVDDVCCPGTVGDLGTSD